MATGAVEINMSRRHSMISLGFNTLHAHAYSDPLNIRRSLSRHDGFKCSPPKYSDDTELTRFVDNDETDEQSDEISNTSFKDIKQQLQKSAAEINIAFSRMENNRKKKGKLKRQISIILEETDDELRDLSLIGSRRKGGNPYSYFMFPKIICIQSYAYLRNSR